jgi:Helix-turn-helix domain
MASDQMEAIVAKLRGMPPGSLVPRDWLLEQLGESTSEIPAPEAPEVVVDLKIDDLAKLFGKRPSTVRGWVERGDFPGAYKLNGKEWRVPASGVKAFQDAQRTGRQGHESGRRAPRLSRWRRVGATGTADDLCQPRMKARNIQASAGI